MTGTVKVFNEAKGYGFITPDDGKKDIFVHISVVEKSGINSLNENDKVSYDEARNNGKVSAANIKVLNDQLISNKNSSFNKRAIKIF